MWLTKDQVNEIGFSYVGENCLISDKASFYNAKNISIGDNSRIDDFCVLSAGAGGIDIGRYVHIGVFCAFLGGGSIVLGDYSGTSGRVTIYSSTDPYDGSFMTNPCIPEQFRNTQHLPVTLEKHVVVGSGSIVLPGVLLEKGCAVGAMSLVTKSFPPNKIIVGIPAREIRDRKLYIYDLENLLENETKSSKLESRGV